MLLDDVCKLFESCYITPRQASLQGRDGSGEQPVRFPFRSTVDAIMRARALVEEAVSQGKDVLEVSLDIAPMI